MARWSSGLRLRPLTPATRVRISYGSPKGIKRETALYILVGVHYDEGPPVPIPNTVVKLIRAENTWRAASWKDRSAPTQITGLLKQAGETYSSIAQSVEHAAVNRRVVGSSPTWGAKKTDTLCVSVFFFFFSIEINPRFYRGKKKALAKTKRAS